MTDEELLEARGEAWVEWIDWENTQYYPRWYKKGNNWINPWLTVNELLEAKAHRKSLAQAYINLTYQCHDRRIGPMSEELLSRWREITTPQGKRYIR